jgi:transposase
MDLKIKETTINFPSDLASCHALLSKYHNEVYYLKHELSQLKRMIFGQKSEKIVPFSQPEQMVLEGLFDTDAPEPGFAEDKETITYERRKKKKGHGRNAIPDDLYCEEVVLEPLGEEKQCGCCGKEKKCIGREETKILDYKPAVLFAKKYIRPKYVCSDCPDQGVTTALLPSRPIEKGVAGNGLLAYLLISKYVDHLPLYRLEQIFKRYTVHINRSTMVGWIAQVCKYLQLIYDTMQSELLQSTYLQSDETPLKVQDRSKSKKCHYGYLWPYTDGRTIVFEYCKSRSREGPVNFLDSFSGYLQTDDYGGYNEVASKPGVTRLLCWAHARRKFVEVKDIEPKYVEKVLFHIAKLYAVEKYCRTERLSPEKRYKVRNIDVPDYLDELKDILEHPGKTLLPKNPVSKAIKYTLSNWNMLIRYLDDGRLEIDNNRIENAIRPVALGRKNWLFAGSHDGAQRLAILYTIFGTCKMNDINPYEYIKDVLDKVVDYPSNKIKGLTPVEWKKRNERHEG